MAGIIGGFLAQKTNNAANLGVWVHSKCAKDVSKKKGKTLVASDLIERNWKRNKSNLMINKSITNLQKEQLENSISYLKKII